MILFQLPNDPRVGAFVGLLLPVAVCMLIAAALVLAQLSWAAVFLLCWACFSVVLGFNTDKFDALLGSSSRIPLGLWLVITTLVALAYAFLVAQYSEQLRVLLTLVG